MKQLESLTIEQFRGLRNLKLEGLGRISLLVGQNNAGKSSVLEALSCYSHPLDGFHWLETGLRRFGRTRGVSRIEAVKWLFPQSSGSSPLQFYERGRAVIQSSGEYGVEECRAEFEEFEAIRKPRKGAAAREVIDTLVEGVSGQDAGLGRRGAELRLQIQVGRSAPVVGASSRSRQLTIWDDKTIIKRKPRDEILLPAESLSAHQIQGDSASAEKFSEFRRMGLYSEAIEILRQLDDGVQEVLVLAESGGIGRLYVEHARTGLTPLSACGDGMRRALQIAMTIPRVRNGILLVDEIESALHTSALASVFRLLASACKEHNVQLFATTHSLEAVDAILQAALPDPQVDLVSYRLERGVQETRAIRLDEATLATVRNELGQEVPVMPRYAILAVEGNHDQAFVAKVLMEVGFKDFKGKASELDPFWDKFKPTYPRNGMLYDRLDMPSILSTDDLSVAVYAAEGSNLKGSFPKTFANRPEYRDAVAAFGIVADADKADAARVAGAYATAYQPHFPKFPDRPGAVDTSAIRTGIYVLPDNVQSGVLETLVIPCGDVVYPKHMGAARKYLGEFAAGDKGHWGPFDEQKALVATVASVLQPGATNTVTIKRDGWIGPATAAQVQPFVDFLRRLLDLP